MTASSLMHQLWRSIQGSHVSTALALSFVLAGCDEEPTQHTTDVPKVIAGDPVPSSASMTTMSLALPYTGTVSSSVPAFEVKQTGSSYAGRFEISNYNVAAPALSAFTKGRGAALNVFTAGSGEGAVVQSVNKFDLFPALYVGSSSLGRPNSAAALEVAANNVTSIHPAATIRNYGKSSVLTLNHKGTVGDLATLQVNEVNKIRFSRTGRGYFNGGTQLGGADVAEAFEVEGSVRFYQPGDVLTISERSDRTVAQSDQPYSTLVIGVYASRPGVLLTERDIDAGLDDMVPVGVIGVIPTKVSAENGPIRRGDLLVTAETPGHAMLGTERNRMLGAVIGKALAGFSGPGTSTIPVLVNVK